jgi:hypothetical protein
LFDDKKFGGKLFGGEIVQAPAAISKMMTDLKSAARSPHQVVCFGDDLTKLARFDTNATGELAGLAFT